MSILRTILDRVENQVSEDWFRNQLIQELGSTNFNDDAADTNGFYPGQLYFFTYSAQTKQPYYDMYPLSYIIEYQKGGFLGCNLHYVRLTQRDRLAIKLLNNSVKVQSQFLKELYINTYILVSEVSHIAFLIVNGQMLLNYQLKNLLI